MSKFNNIYANKITVNGSMISDTILLSDTQSAFYLNLISDSSATLTADRTLTFDNINGNRIVKLGGNLTISNAFETTNSIILRAPGPADITLPTTGTLVTTTGTNTLTNKNITGSTNIVGASQLRTTGAPVIINTATPPTAGKALIAISATEAGWATAIGGNYTLWARGLNKDWGTSLTLGAIF